MKLSPYAFEPHPLGAGSLRHEGVNGFETFRRFALNRGRLANEPRERGTVGNLLRD
jgi:hypothetical protein